MWTKIYGGSSLASLLAAICLIFSQVPYSVMVLGSQQDQPVDDTPIGNGAGSPSDYECRNLCYYTLTLDNTTTTIPYRMLGVIENIELNKERKSLVISINTTSENRLQIVLPRSIIQSMTGENDTHFTAFVDGKSSTVEDLGQNATIRSVFVYYEPNSREIEIVGTWVVPEFSSSLFFLAIAAAVIPSLLTRRNIASIMRLRLAQ